MSASPILNESIFRKQVLERLTSLEKELIEIKIMQRKILNLSEKEDQDEEKITFKSKREQMQLHIKSPRHFNR